MKKILYLGTSPAQFAGDGHLVHYPVIKIVPRGTENQEVREALEELDAYSHLIFTSKNAVKIFFALVDPSAVKNKFVLAVGKVTALHLEMHGITPNVIASEETQEGIIAELQQLDLKNSYIFLPRSQRSRPELVRFLEKQGVRFRTVDLYDTVSQRLEPVPDLKVFDEIVFTSPSTVAAFKEIFGALPRGKKLLAIGPVTEEALKN